MIKKTILSILIILCMISFFWLVIDINREPVKEQPKVTLPIKPKPLPETKYVIPEYPPVSDEMMEDQLPVSKDLKKEKLAVPRDIKKEALPVVKTVKKEEGPAPPDIKEEAPVSKEIKKEKMPVTEKSQKEISKLKEKCEKQSKKIFSKQYNDGTIENSKGTFLYKYKNHYNKKLNKCFMVITEDGVLERYKKLLDVDENNSYGSVRINNEQENLGCYLLEKKCKSEEEWDLIVKPYMEQ
ncbi:MAG: hypothetical protein JW925_05985 [Syntrophaceae bacterium]|nr:hypothetical protein [Syntrophaceae bacterium]